MNRIKTRLAKLTASGTMLSVIGLSHSNKAFAECFADSNGYGCVDFSLTCLPEGTTQQVNVNLHAGYGGEPNGFLAYPLYISLSNSDGLLSISNPSIAYFNGYDGVTNPFPNQISGNGFVTLTTNITATVVDAQYNNPPVSRIDFNSIFTDPDNNHEPYDGTVRLNGYRNVRIENVNTAPNISASSSRNGNNLTITANISDPESNVGVVIFEISDDPSFAFSFPEFWHSYDDILFEKTGTTISHTFNISELQNGTYYWRAAAVEYGIDPTCAGTAYQINNNSFTALSWGNLPTTPIEDSTSTPTPIESIAEVTLGAGTSIQPSGNVLGSSTLSPAGLDYGIIFALAGMIFISSAIFFLKESVMAFRQKILQA